MFWLIVAAFSTIIGHAKVASVVLLYITWISKAIEFVGLFSQKFLFIYVGHFISELFAFIILIISATEIKNYIITK